MILLLGILIQLVNSEPGSYTFINSLNFLAILRYSLDHAIIRNNYDYCVQLRMGYHW